MEQAFDSTIVHESSSSSWSDGSVLTCNVSFVVDNLRGGYKIKIFLNEWCGNYESKNNKITEARLDFVVLTTSHVTSLAQPLLSLGGVEEFRAVASTVVSTQLALGMEARATLLFLACTTTAINENILNKTSVLMTYLHFCGYSLSDRSFNRLRLNNRSRSLVGYWWRRW